MPKWLDEMTDAGEPVIPENLKTLVWEREEKQCASCGATEAVGIYCVEPYGMPTEANTKLLCKPCRRNL